MPHARDALRHGRATAIEGCVHTHGGGGAPGPDPLRRTLPLPLPSVCARSACARCGHVVRVEKLFLKKDVMRVVQRVASSKKAWLGLGGGGRHWQWWPGIDSGVRCP